MTDIQNIENLRGATLFGNDGEKIGKIGEIYLDDQTNQPTFATVNTGLFGLKESFVPLDQVQHTADGVTVPFSKDFVKDAPNIADDGDLTPEEEQRIYDYYAGHRTTAAAGAADDTHTREGYGAADADRSTADDSAAGAANTHPREGYGAVDAGADTTAADRAGAVDGDADVVAHEERLVAGDTVEQRETGRVRLRKHVVTDTQTVEVPVRREELHIEREAIDPNSPEARAAADRAFQGDGEEVVVTTHEERPVVTTETVATERVSLNKEAVEDTERVSADVRREEIVVDEDGTRNDGKGL
jgi:uncharacterized protein (TIGR02271 family)